MAKKAPGKAPGKARRKGISLFERTAANAPTMWLPGYSWYSNTPPTSSWFGP